MWALVYIIHIVVCVGLILIVLLQTGKGANLGAAFGGGSSQTLFGTTGATSFLNKLTTVIAIIFMLTSLSLAYHSSEKPSQSVVIERTTEQSNQASPTQPAPTTDSTTNPTTGTEQTTTPKP
ncbi:MAG: preprotein translocase subunit SecG [Desulfobacterales bacterium]|nr:preprotein translocase subunit SecG [Desulfobacterales bacterium]